MKENIKAPRHWPLCGDFTGTGEFPAQMASYAEMFPFDDVIMTFAGQERLVSLSDKSRLSYTEAVLHEAMRLYPIVPLAVPRATSCDVEIRKFLNHSSKSPESMLSCFVTVSSLFLITCLLNRLFRCRSKKTSKFRITGLLVGAFPAQRNSIAENVSIWWLHHVTMSPAAWMDAKLQLISHTYLNTPRGVPGLFCMLRQFISYMERLLKCWVSIQ